MTTPTDNKKPIILAVDDQIELLNLLQMIMPFHGYDVNISLNGENLFDMIKAKVPDVFFLDIQMNGIDGAVLCTLLKSNQSTANVPVVMVSGNDNIATVSAACGANAFIKKPFSTEEVDKVLYDLVGSKQADFRSVA